MTSFNRIGLTWAGGHYNLVTQVLRNEWGFNGFVLTDYEVGQGKGGYMDTLQTLGAGGDAKLKTVGMDALFGFNIAKYPAYQGMGREAAHHILYTVVNSAAMNGVGADTIVRTTTPALLRTLEKVTLGLGVAAFLFIAMWFRGSRKLRKTEAYLLYKAAKRQYKASKKSQ